MTSCVLHLVKEIINFLTPLVEPINFRAAPLVKDIVVQYKNLSVIYKMVDLFYRRKSYRRLSFLYIYVLNFRICVIRLPNSIRVSLPGSREGGKGSITRILHTKIKVIGIIHLDCTLGGGSGLENWICQTYKWVKYNYLNVHIFVFFKNFSICVYINSSY